MSAALMEQTFAVQAWLVAEARLLDARRFDLWLDLLDDQIRYRVPDRSFVSQTNIGDFRGWSVDAELEHPQGLALIDDDLAALRQKVERLRTGMAWSEIPASMARRLVGNVMVERGDDEGLSVASTLFLSKVRREGTSLFTAERRDRLVRHGEGFRLRERYVVLDQVVLHADNLSLLF
jgi:3-phenylpropionate/cinnamic acid dioxygenase small subunit